MTWLIIGTILDHNGITSFKLAYDLNFYCQTELSPRLYSKLLEFKDHASSVFRVPNPLSQLLLHDGAREYALHVGNA